MRRQALIRVTVAALGLVFFFTPVALRLVGVQPRPFENRPLAAAPRLAQGFRFFNGATRFLIDRMPLRDQAVHANTWIDEHIFATNPDYGANGLGGVQADQGALPFSGTTAQDRARVAGNAHAAAPQAAVPSTASQVIVGRDGWLYLQGVLDRACHPFIAFGAAVREWERLIDVIRASGRRVVLVVPPDKSSLYPEYLPASTPNLACGRQGTDALWSLLQRRSVRAAGILPLRAPLLAEKRADPAVRLYFKTDSHWNAVGALSMTQAVLPALSRTVRLLPSDVVTTPPIRYAGDLLTLSGLSYDETAPTRAIRRAPGAPVIQAPTVLVGDSYAEMPGTNITQPLLLEPYFRHLTYVNWNTTTPRRQAAAIRAAREVVLESVEREFDYRATPDGFASPAFVALVARTLGVRP
ncbi:MAG TPA: hypothetical protein VFN55_08815 [Solirubrobacteraceae bacterium]|nr:hypothetical protein [Solirubrobacteraceae bacterium]